MLHPATLWKWLLCLEGTFSSVLEKELCVVTEVQSASFNCLITFADISNDIWRSSFLFHATNFKVFCLCYGVSTRQRKCAKQVITAFWDVWWDGLINKFVFFFGFFFKLLSWKQQNALCLRICEVTELRLLLSEAPNRLGVSLPSLEDENRPSFGNIVIQNSGRKTKSRKSTILCSLDRSFR
jgi:hypothetical protein